jgi:hypothetical protein
MSKSNGVFCKYVVKLPKVLKMFLSISYTNAIILPNFYKQGIIGIIHNCVVMLPVFSKNILPIIYTNGIVMSIFIKRILHF